MRPFAAALAICIVCPLAQASQETSAATTTTAPLTTTTVPTTAAPTTVAPTTASPTTVAPTTAAPTTMAPTTAAPTTVAPTTAAPTTMAPTTAAPTTMAPTTAAPTTMAPTAQLNFVAVFFGLVNESTFTQLFEKPFCEQVNVTPCALTIVAIVQQDGRLFDSVANSTVTFRFDGVAYVELQNALLRLTTTQLGALGIVSLTYTAVAPPSPPPGLDRSQKLLIAFCALVGLAVIIILAMMLLRRRRRQVYEEVGSSMGEGLAKR